MTDEEIKLNAIAIAEGWYEKEGTEEEKLIAWQHLIDTGLCWTYQGWFGRNAIWLVENGFCRPSEIMIKNRLISKEVIEKWEEQRKEQTGSESE